MGEVDRTVERVVRESYGQLLGWLASRSGDLAASEDALADAFRTALETWPSRGVPARPVGWLLTAARNRLRDAARHGRVADGARDALRVHLEDRAGPGEAETMDHRLALLFACAHPVVPDRDRTPLMLQVVLGFDAAEVARAFLLPPGTMAKRLTRAKRRISEARVPFALPGPDERAPRLPSVLDAIYAAYGSSWDYGGEPADGVDPLRAEALALAVLVARELPTDPEANGLAALLCHVEARRGARVDADGAFVPLDAQDVAAWDRALVDRAEAHLEAAARRATPGRYQLEAAIQSAHAARRLHGADTWPEIARLYATLDARHPTVGGRLGLCAAWAEGGRAAEALAWLDGAPPDWRALQPYWALRASLLERLDRPTAAADAYARALELTVHPPVRRWLEARRARLGAAS